jgi:transcription termination factor Rho
MREKLETLSLTTLKDLAKQEGIKGISGLRKAEIIDLLCEQEEKGKQEKETAAPAPAKQVPAPKTQENRVQETRPQSSRYQESHEQENRSQENRENRSQETRPQENRSQDNRSRDNQRNNRSYERYGQTRPQIRTYGSNNYNNNRYNNNNNYSNNSNNSNNNNNYNNNSNNNNNSGNSSSYRDNSDSCTAAAQSQTAASTSQGYSAQNQTYGQNNSQNMDNQERMTRPEYRNDAMGLTTQDMTELDSGIEANGILEVMPDGFGFIRCENFLPGENDVYVAPSQIRRFNLKTGDIIIGNRRIKAATEKFAALLYIKTVNGYPLSATETRPNFEDLTPIFPNQRLHMENPREKTTVAMRVLDLLAPIGKGQRGMIVSPPKAGKTTLLKQVAKAITTNHPDMHLMILLIDERPEEVTDIKEAIVGPNVEVIYSTFDELPERHKRVSEMVIERAKRLVEHGRDVIILLDSITRLARAYNLTVAPSGRTLSGGLDPAALHMPKRFFGAARNMREKGSLTILATALVDTGSRMDDVVYEEFKGTGNMELVLDRKLSEKRIFPAIDILKSGTRRDDLLLTKEEAEAVDIIRKATNSLKPDEAVEKILDLFAKTRNNREFVEMVKKIRFF